MRDSKSRPQEENMDAVTPKARKSERHSHVVRPANMEWQPTRFPGCEVKTLLFDRDSGLVTALMRFAPGAVLPDHEHVKIEQTYVLEGKLVDKEGPAAGLEVKAGEFRYWGFFGKASSCVHCEYGARSRRTITVPVRSREISQNAHRWHASTAAFTAAPACVTSNIAVPSARMPGGDGQTRRRRHRTATSMHARAVRIHP